MSERAVSFSALLEAAKAGEARALAALWSRHEPAVRGAVRRRLSADLRRHCDTSDVTQSVFRALARDLPRLGNRGEPAFRRLLYLKAESEVGQLRRREGRAQRALARAAQRAPSRAEPAPSAAAVRGEDAARVRAAVGALDGVTAHVVRLRAMGGHSFAAIARDLSLPGAEAARKRYERGLGRLELTLRPSPRR